MALSNYSELVASVADYLIRPELTTVIPDFITLAEKRINRNLRHRKMETRSDASTVAGERYIGLPSDFLEMRAIQHTLVGVNTALSAMTIDAMNKVDTANVQSIPTNFAITGDQLRLYPTPNNVYALEMVYYASVPALTASDPTNWLLSYAPDLYLYGTLTEAQPYLKGDDRIEVWMGLYDRAMADLRGEDARAKWSGQVLRTSVDIQVPSRFNIYRGS